MADDFCKEFALQQEKYMIEDSKKKHRNKPNRMSDAEIMVLLILFHSGGFRCYLIINDKGEILNFMFTPANVDDREPLKQGKFVENIKGKLCADKGYIGQALFENLFLNGIQLVTKVKSNMKNSLMSIADKILLRKKALIETVNDELKNIAQIEHSRHRSFNNFIANSLSAIAAYCFFEKKPAIDVNFVNDGQLSIF
ncbi:IS982 family transposase [Phocaeicola sp. HCN-40430]|uniref:IS982 family transposase n=1 Tax=Phocaeicola sp. HCN-40430 TaxID=3134664 RepID=UPI0030C42111